VNPQPPIDPEAAELLDKVPDEAFDFENGETAEKLGLEPDPNLPPTQFPHMNERGRLVVVFAMEYFRGEHRILLDRGGSLPAWRLPDEHGAADFVQSHGCELLNSPIVNVRQIGSVRASQMDLYIVTGDVLQPAGCLDHEVTPKYMMWTPRSEIVRIRTLQSFMIAFAQTRLEGWHIDDPATDEFVINYKMQLAPILEPRPGNPQVVQTGPPIAEEEAPCSSGSDENPE
jgi:hypothetical protein